LCTDREIKNPNIEKLKEKIKQLESIISKQKLKENKENQYLFLNEPKSKINLTKISRTSSEISGILQSDTYKNIMQDIGKLRNPKNVVQKIKLNTQQNAGINMFIWAFQKKISKQFTEIIEILKTRRILNLRIITIATKKLSKIYKQKFFTNYRNKIAEIILKSKKIKKKHKRCHTEKTTVKNSAKNEKINKKSSNISMISQKQPNSAKIMNMSYCQNAENSFIKPKIAINNAFSRISSKPNYLRQTKCSFHKLNKSYIA